MHVLLEEIGKSYQTEKLGVAGGDTHKPPFTSINPKGKVPTLVRDDGSVLPEYVATASWLARTNPEEGSMPSKPGGEARALEVMDYVVGALHMQGFARIFKPETFEPPDVVHGTLGLGAGAIKKQGHAMVEQAFTILAPQLAGRGYVAGDRLTIADGALFYATRWVSIQRRDRLAAAPRRPHRAHEGQTRRPARAGGMGRDVGRGASVKRRCGHPLARSRIEDRRCA